MGACYAVLGRSSPRKPLALLYGVLEFVEGGRARPAPCGCLIHHNLFAANGAILEILPPSTAKVIRRHPCVHAGDVRVRCIQVVML